MSDFSGRAQRRSFDHQTGLQLDRSYVDAGSWTERLTPLSDEARASRVDSTGPRSAAVLTTAAPTCLCPPWTGGSRRFRPEARFDRFFRSDRSDVLHRQSAGRPAGLCGARSPRILPRPSLSVGPPSAATSHPTARRRKRGTVQPTRKYATECYPIARSNRREDSPIENIGAWSVYTHQASSGFIAIFLGRSKQLLFGPSTSGHGFVRPSRGSGRD